ncbi:depupylase/deamidase Dop [Cellulomonas sp. RIT-PI-Y]|uniref:depupylase/deamidase Dop n=1 Tax=Cellulomonas sp. RIT-PI-Y TaxID=3035297 RepID=UPI003211EC51
MTVRRVMGIETEYGVLQPGKANANPMLLSSHVVAVHAPAKQAGRTKARWDYDDEDPLQDARGFHLQRAAAHPSQLTDDPARPAPSGDTDPDSGASTGPSAPQTRPRPEYDEYEDPGAVNVILTNGARLYVDHAHPEYSSPEVTTPRDLVRWDVAGERVMLESVRALAGVQALPDVALYKNNVDGKGATYGTHENYLVDRAVPFGDLASWITPFLVSRQVFTGSGRVGLGQRGERPGYQLSQRADYVEAEIGLETTLRRPIVNTRDEPHADPALWRRLHVIVGDANLFEVATFLKTGSTSLVLWLIEQISSGAASHWGPRLDALTLADPVHAFGRVSHDLSLREPLDLADGRAMTALDLQRVYLEALRELIPDPDPETAEVLDRWASILDRLAVDPASCAREVEWVGKLRLLDGMRRREELAWDHPKLLAVDLQWSDVRPERGLYHRLAAAGAVERLTTDDQVADAVVHPPADTRAYFRGEVMARFGPQITAASWDSVVFDVPGAPSLQRVPMRDPLRGTRAHVGPLLDSSPDAGSLLEKLGG